MLATCGADNAIKLWNAADGSLVRTETGDINRTRDYRREVTSVAFIGGSSVLLAASGDRTVRTHHARNASYARTFSGSPSFVYTAASTPDGRIILGGGHDGVLRLWDGDNGNPLRDVRPTGPP